MPPEIYTLWDKTKNTWILIYQGESRDLETIPISEAAGTIVLVEPPKSVVGQDGYLETPGHLVTYCNSRYYISLFGSHMQ